MTLAIFPLNAGWQSRPGRAGLQRILNENIGGAALFRLPRIHLIFAQIDIAKEPSAVSARARARSPLLFTVFFHLTARAREIAHERRRTAARLRRRRGGSIVEIIRVQLKKGSFRSSTDEGSLAAIILFGGNHRHLRMHTRGRATPLPENLPNYRSALFPQKTTVRPCPYRCQSSALQEQRGEREDVARHAKSHETRERYCRLEIISPFRRRRDQAACSRPSHLFVN